MRGAVMGLLAAACSGIGAGIAQGQIVAGGGATGTSVNVSTLNTGTVLQVEGAVSGDGRYVTMNLDPQFSTLDAIDTFVISNNGVGTGLGGGGFANGAARAIGVRRVPFRPAQVGEVTFVDQQKDLLQTKVPAISLKQTSMRAAVQKLAAESKRNIVLGIRALEEAGVNTKEPKDFDLPAGTLKDSLLEVLKTGTGDQPMVITAEDQVISIATQAQADNTVITKNYYLEDLLGNAPLWMAAGTDLQQLGAKYGVGESSLDFSKPQPEGAGKKAIAAKGKPGPTSTNIVELISSTVRPEIWKVNGGKIGEIGVTGHIVVIRAPQSVHALLEGPKRYNPNKVPVYIQYGQ